MSFPYLLLEACEVATRRCETRIDIEACRGR